MAISLTNENKSKISLSNEDKSNEVTWNEAIWAWDEATGLWGRPGYVLTKGEVKSGISLSNEAKT